MFSVSMILFLFYCLFCFLDSIVDSCEFIAILLFMFLMFLKKTH